MIAFKCKMCGGNLNPEENATTCECEYCGSVQTIPAADSEKKMNLFGRAQRLLRACEFDKASAVYESIVAEFPEEAEAYWGLCLCKYGIEYVDDPVTGKKVPTCHRTRSDSIVDDSDFDQACENADAIARRVYREEAKAIDRLQLDILSIVANEAPYDAFICYKETGEDGQRTEDSVLGQEIYDALTVKGLKVFFARITLEDKLGQQYEPYIYAALHSAKVLLAIGTQFEYFDAVWVKNEWARFLDMMRTDKAKTLIPCYKGIDAYDMPREFKNLQAQDMGKLGWLQDLARGVMKLCGKDDRQIAQAGVITAVHDNNMRALLTRVRMFAQDGEWSRAAEYIERVLDSDPKCSEAYLLRLMIALKCDSEAKLATIPAFLDGNRDFIRAREFADALQLGALDRLRENCAVNALKVRLIKIVKELIRQEQKKIEEWERVEQIKQLKYQSADRRMAALSKNSDSKQTAKQWEQLAATFDAIDWGNAVELAEQCRAKAEAVREAMAQRSHAKARAQEEAARIQAEYDKAFKNYQEAAARRKPHEKAFNDASKSLSLAQGALRDFQGELQNLRGLFTGRRKRELEEKIAEYQRKVDLLSSEVAACEKKMNAIILPEKPDKREAQNRKGVALLAFRAARGYDDLADRISCGEKHIVGLRSDGTLMGTGYPCNVIGWSDIVAVSCGPSSTVGLKSNRTVVATGDNLNHECDVSSWSDIVAISCGSRHTVGLKLDGTVVATGMNQYGQCNVSGWSDILAVSCGNWFTVGLKSDGTVVTTGSIPAECNVRDWNDIVSLSGGGAHIVGLKSNGTVVATGGNSYGQCNVSGWRDIVAVSCGSDYTVGLKSDGMVVATGYNFYGQCNANGWSNIVAISCGAASTVCLKSNGTVSAVGEALKNNRCNVSNWNLLN